MNPDPPWAVCAVDLDQTLIYSRTAGGAAVVDPVCVERLDGAPLSYLTAGAAALLARWPSEVALVAVTTRTLAQWERVRLPVATSYAVAANGGHLLVGGRPDRAWAAEVAVRLSDARPVADVLRVVERAAADWARVVRVADGLFVYAVAAAERLPAGALADCEAWLADGGWTLSRQGRKVYATPIVLTKQAAIGCLLGRLAGAGRRPRLLAAGDSRLDAGLLAAAEAAIRPGHGELAAGGAPAGVAVTPSSGMAAGEEILRWLLERAQPLAIGRTMPTQE